MESVLVTGAGGYIGSNAAEYFAKAGYRVIGTLRNRVAERLTRLGIKTIKIDLADAADLPRLFEEKIDYVVHVAARASDVGRDEWFRKANYDAVKNLASAAMEHGVKRFVYLSTADVYGLHDFSGEREEGLAFDEMVTNPYPKYKILSEKWLAANLPRERFSCVTACGTAQRPSAPFHDCARPREDGLVSAGGRKDIAEDCLYAHTADSLRSRAQVACSTLPPIWYNVRHEGEIQFQGADIRMRAGRHGDPADDMQLPAGGREHERRGARILQD